MTPQTFLAIDQGTTNTKALLFDLDGKALAQASRPTSLSYPHAGWAEQSALDIWTSVQQVITDIDKSGHPIGAIGLSNQRESIVVWDVSTGQPLGPCVSWQCTRSAPLCERLKAEGYEPDVVARTGLTLSPMFSAGKLSWILDQIPDGRAGAESGRLKAGTVDTWILWNLTGGARHATDHSNASRTQLMNLESLRWDHDVARLFDIPVAMLPEILASDSLFGRTAASACALPEGVPIQAVLGDSHAALYGHGLSGPGEVKVTCGTGSSVMTVTDTRVWSAHGLSSTIAWSENTRSLHALEGNISVSGLTAAFATRLLGLDDEDALTRLANEVEDSGGVSFVPALAGLGAPHWNDEARGTLTGMSLGTRPAHVARAALEAMALQIHDVFEAMSADLHARLAELNVDGGAARNDTFVQLLSDLIDRPVHRAGVTDVSALGAARMAAKGLGLDMKTSRDRATTFRPSMRPSQRQAILERWRLALRQATAR